MSARTYLAFDFGERRIGVAVGNDLTGTAKALTAIDASNDDARFSAVTALVAEWLPEAFVVGLPTHPDGTAHAMTQRCERFARQLHGRFQRPAYLVDERYTSVEAAQQLAGGRLQGQRKKQAIDAEAAAQILRRFFDEGAISVAGSATATAS